MAIKSLKRLVVDADVAQAAGFSENPRTTACRGLLNEILHLGHRFVSTPDIDKEWRKHASPVSSRWQAIMLSRSRIAVVEPVPSGAFEAAVQSGDFGSTQRKTMLKDLPLVCAAAAADRAILSMDETARGLFSKLSVTERTLKRIAWGNPTRPEEAILAWLRAGAKIEKPRCLGA